ncbi:MAG: FHA domain-containing protein [Pseudomonadota bacterium]
MLEVPRDLQLGECALNVWVTAEQRPACLELLGALEQTGVRFNWPGGPAALPGKYFGDRVSEGHILCWSAGWHSHRKTLLKLLRSAQAHQYLLLDLDGSLPDEVRAGGLTVSGVPAWVQLQVLRFALQRIEWTWGRPDDIATQVMPASLHIRFAGRQLQVPADFDGLIAAGRGSECQVQLPSSYVSRLHGCFQATVEGFSYRDMSRNGTVLLQAHEEMILHETEVLLRGQGELRMGDQLVSFRVA